ncbi:MAG: DUF4199 domain-containing protein [Bacteroidetes bacterium]|nr:DUF4199 domain-containing protein [Bacteroidota bacterium]
MKKIVIVYGLIAGLILVSMIFIMMALVGDSSDFDRGESVGYISMVLAFSMIFFGIRSHRDKNLGGAISFNISFRTGILITVIACLCYVAGWLFYINYIDNSFIEKYAAFYLNKLNSSGKSSEEIKNEIVAFNKNMENYDNPGVMALFTFLEVFPIGLIISVLCALLMRRKVSDLSSEPKEVT